MTSDVLQMQDYDEQAKEAPLGRVRIVSDGTPMGTKLLNADGVPVKGIVRIEWRVDVNDLATATVEFANVELDVIGRATAVGTERVGDPELDG